MKIRQETLIFLMEYVLPLVIVVIVSVIFLDMADRLVSPPENTLASQRVIRGFLDPLEAR